jgi:hypothetical protein
MVGVRSEERDARREALNAGAEGGDLSHFLEVAPESKVT